MNIQTLTLGPLATNCYLVRADESRRAVIIDPAANSKRLLAALEEQGLTLEAILLTHAHFDHIGALKNLRAATNAPRLYRRGRQGRPQPYVPRSADLYRYVSGRRCRHGGRSDAFRCSLRPAIRRAPCACCVKMRCFPATRFSRARMAGQTSSAGAAGIWPRL